MSQHSSTLSPSCLPRPTFLFYFERYHTLRYLTRLPGLSQKAENLRFSCCSLPSHWDYRPMSPRLARQHNRLRKPLSAFVYHSSAFRMYIVHILLMTLWPLSLASMLLTISRTLYGSYPLDSHANLFSVTVKILNICFPQTFR